MWNFIKEIPEETLNQMKRLREEGFNWEQIARKFGINSKTIRRRLDPEFRNKDIQQHRASRFYGGVGCSERAPMTRQEVVAYRIKHSIPDPRDFTGRFLGDPIPGDARRQG